MKSIKLEQICVLPGDGIGPEVTSQGIKVIDAICKKFKKPIAYNYGLIGAAAIDEYGVPFPKETHDLCVASDAVLLGAIGDPKYDDPSLAVRPEQGLLAMRKALDLFANIRPIKMYEGLEHLSVIKAATLEGTDFVILRELTGGIYFGEKVKSEGFASDLCSYHAYEIERVAHLAFKMAMKRKQKVTLVDKANVLETSRLWRATVMKIAQLYPLVTLEFLYIDNAAMQVILNPSRFDVVLCDNLFGDILSDEASVITGSLGMLPSSSRGNEYSLYEPCHGSYPQAANKDIANPIATILSIEMMFRDYGYEVEADEILKSIEFCIKHQLLTTDMKPVNTCGCNQMGDIISTYILEGVNGLKSQNLHAVIASID